MYISPTKSASLEEIENSNAESMSVLFWWREHHAPWQIGCNIFIRGSFAFRFCCCSTYSQIREAVEWWNKSIASQDAISNSRFNAQSTQANKLRRMQRCKNQVQLKHKNRFHVQNVECYHRTPSPSEDNSERHMVWQFILQVKRVAPQSSQNARCRTRKKINLQR